MTNLVTNIGKGSVAEMFRDAAANGIILLMTAIEADDAAQDHAELDAFFTAAGNTEAVDASYGRKTGLTGTVTVDNVNNRVDVDIPDQTFTALDGAAIVKLVIAYENSAAETGRVPLTLHDFAVTPDTNDVEVQIAASGFFRAA